jgi:hypothetical protein
MLADPGPIPHGAEVTTAGLMRLVAGGRLADRELMIAGTIAGSVTALTCATDRIEEQARAALLAEQEAGKRGKPLHLQAVDGGVSATANQRNPQTPQAFMGLRRSRMAGS